MKFRKKPIRDERKKLTLIQNWFLDYWYEFIKLNKKPPTFMDCVKDLKYKGVSSIQRHISALVKKGYLFHKNRKYYPTTKRGGEKIK